MHALGTGDEFDKRATVTSLGPAAKGQGPGESRICGRERCYGDERERERPSPPCLCKRLHRIGLEDRDRHKDCSVRTSGARNARIAPSPIVLETIGFQKVSLRRALHPLKKQTPKGCATWPRAAVNLHLSSVIIRPPDW